MVGSWCYDKVRYRVSIFCVKEAGSMSVELESIYGEQEKLYREILDLTDAPDVISRSRVLLRSKSVESSEKYALKLLKSVQEWVSDVSDRYDMDLVIELDETRHVVIARMGEVVVFKLELVPRRGVIYVKKWLRPFLLVVLLIYKDLLLVKKG